MKLYFPVIVFAIFAVGCFNLKTEAQIKATNSGKIGSKTTPNPKAFDISTIDFKNFTFPEFSDGKVEKAFTLKNGRNEIKNAFPKYILRKTYYFDLTGDRQNEAVSHIIAEGCQLGCETSNLFYIHTAEGRQPKLLWKIATGGDIMGGLKSASFRINEIIFEVFGNCSIENMVIKPEVDLKKDTRLKTANYTRFVFSGAENGFTQISRDFLPLTKDVDFSEYRAKIKFGDDE